MKKNMSVLRVYIAEKTLERGIIMNDGLLLIICHRTRECVLGWLVMDQCSISSCLSEPFIWKTVGLPIMCFAIAWRLTLPFKSLKEDKLDW